MRRTPRSVTGELLMAVTKSPGWIPATYAGECKVGVSGTTPTMPAPFTAGVIVETVRIRRRMHAMPTMKFIPEPAARTLRESLLLDSLSCLSSTSTNAPMGRKARRRTPAALTLMPEVARDYPVGGLVDDDRDDDGEPDAQGKVGVDPRQEEVGEGRDRADVRDDRGALRERSTGPRPRRR